jgi:hypothetical protein
MSSNSLKPIITAIVATAGDKYILNQADMNKSLYFGVAVGAGIYAAQMIVPMLPNSQGSMGDVSIKTLETRIAEIGLGAGAAYALNRFALNNEPNRNDMMKKVALIAASDFVSEYATDYLSGKPLSFLGRE